MTGATFFFTVVTQRRRPLFRQSMYRRFLGASFREGRRELPFEFDAVALLPDHLHILMRPADGVDYSRIWRLIKGSFTHKVIEHQERCRAGVVRQEAPYSFGAGRRKGEADVWQRRFYEHTIRDEVDWGRHVDYIHWNPVKHGYVNRPQDWRWSSIHRYIAKGLLVSNWPAGEELDLPHAQE